MATSENEDVLEMCLEASRLEAGRLLEAARAPEGLDAEQVQKLATIHRTAAYVQKIDVDLLHKVDPEKLGEKAMNNMARAAERMERAAAALKAEREARPAVKERRRK